MSVRINQESIQVMVSGVPGPGNVRLNQLTILQLVPFSQCAVKDNTGNVLGAYINDLRLNIAPATQLFKSYVPSSAISISEATNEGREAIVLDFNSGSGLFSRDIEVAFAWPFANPIALRLWQPSTIMQPESQYNRPADWDDGGSKGNKFIQGVIVTADSFNSAKSFQLQSSDDLSLHALNEVPATFQNQATIALSCVTPFVAHSARLVSTDQVAWKLFDSHIVAEPWPEQCMNWQTEQVSFGMTGWLHAREMNIAYAAVSPLTVVLDFDAWPTITFTLPGTGGALVQAKTKVTLPVNKFKLVSVQIVSTAPYYLFQNDLEFKVKQWGSTEPFQVLKVIGGPSQTGAVV